MPPPPTWQEDGDRERDDEELDRAVQEMRATSGDPADAPAIMASEADAVTPALIDDAGIAANLAELADIHSELERIRHGLGRLLQPRAVRAQSRTALMCR